MITRLLLVLTLIAIPALAQAQGTESRVWDAGASAWTDLERMADALARHDVVFVGEQHDDPATHCFESSTLVI